MMARSKDVELDEKIADLVDCGLGRNLTQMKGRINRWQTQWQTFLNKWADQNLCHYLSSSTRHPPLGDILMNF